MRHPAAGRHIVSHWSRLRLLRLRCAPTGDSVCRDNVLYIIRKLSARALFEGDGGREPLNWAGGGNHADTRTGAEEATEEQGVVWPACYQSGWLRVDTSPANEGRTKILSGAGDLLRFHPGLGRRPFFCGEKKARIVVRSVSSLCGNIAPPLVDILYHTGQGYACSALLRPCG